MKMKSLHGTSSQNYQRETLIGGTLLNKLNDLYLGRNIQGYASPIINWYYNLTIICMVMNKNNYNFYSCYPCYLLGQVKLTNNGHIY